MCDLRKRKRRAAEKDGETKQQAGRTLSHGKTKSGDRTTMVCQTMRRDCS